MAIIMGYAMFRGKAYDGLSSLSLACFITLLINPNSMYSVSFQLSYISVFSIFCLAPPLSSWLQNYFNKKFSATFAMNLAISFGVLAISLCYFGKFPLISIPINLLLIPIASASFVLLFVGVVIATIMPFASFLLLGYKSLMGVVVKFNVWASTFNLSMFATTGALSVLVMLMVTFVLSDYLFVSNKTKKVIALLGAATFLSMLVFV